MASSPTRENGITPTTAGYVYISVANSGAYTGKIFVGPTAFPISGQFAGTPDGAISGSTTLNPKTKPVTVMFDLDTEAEPPAMTVSVAAFSDKTFANPLWTSSGELSLAGPAAPAPAVGRYNIAVPGFPASVNDGAVTSDGPYGYGYASATLDAKGNVTVVANLPDGSPAVTFATYLTTDGRFPFFSSLYKGKGLVGTWFQFTNDMDNSFDVEADGDGVWIALPGAVKAYPTGFSSEETPFDQMAGGDHYVPPAKGGNVFGATALDFMFGFDDTMNRFPFTAAKSTFTVPAPQKLALAPATGLVSGSLFVPGLLPHKVHPFAGLYLPRRGVGYGFSTDLGLPFTFAAPPPPPLGMSQMSLAPSPGSR